MITYATRSKVWLMAKYPAHMEPSSYVYAAYCCLSYDSSSKFTYRYGPAFQTKLKTVSSVLMMLMSFRLLLFTYSVFILLVSVRHR